MTRWNFSSTGAEVIEASKERVKGKTSKYLSRIKQERKETDKKPQVLVTGPSPNSIGAETAVTLASGRPSILILTGRSKAKLEPLITSIHSISPSTAVHFVPLDLSNQKSVRKCVEEVKGVVKERGIDILVHSAGIIVTPYEKIPGWGKDGKGEVEGQFATNYLGSFLLVNLLIPEILKGYEGKGGRVVLLSSSAHRMGGVRFEDINFKVRKRAK
jgi:NAD(P)-dependent dehydrogenase (short-subunit alcohol dehydrogenase family)